MISEWRLTWCQPCKELASFLKASVIDSAKYQVLHLFLYWIRIFESDLSKDTFKEWVKYVYTIRMIEICIHNSTKSSYSTNKFGPKCFHDSFQYLRKSFSGLFTEWFSSEVAWIRSATLLKDNFVTKAGTAKPKKNELKLVFYTNLIRKLIIKVHYKVSLSKLIIHTNYGLVIKSLYTNL